MVVAGEANRNWSHRGESEIYDGKGEPIEFDSYLSGNWVIINYSPSGDVNWTTTLSTRYCEVFGLTYNDSGQVVLLANVEYIDFSEAYGKFGYLPSLSGNKKIAAGYHLILLDNAGTFIRTDRVFEDEHTRMDIEGFSLSCLPGKAEYLHALSREALALSESSFLQESTAVVQK